MTCAYGPPFGIEAGAPGNLHERLSQQKFAGHAVEHVKVAVAIGEQHQLTGKAMPRGVHQHRYLGGVKIEFVVRGELKKPLQLAAIGVQCDDGTGIEVVAFAACTVPIGTGIADTPVQELQHRIVGAGSPDGAATVYPGLARPGFIAWLTRPGNRVEAPEFPAGVRGIGGKEAADAVFTACWSGNYFVSDYERCNGHGISRLRSADGRFPEFVSVTGIEREQIAVQRTHEQPGAQDCESAIHTSTACTGGCRRVVGVGPEYPAGGGVDGDDDVGRLNGVQHSVDYE